MIATFFFNLFTFIIAGSFKSQLIDYFKEIFSLPTPIWRGSLIVDLVLLGEKFLQTPVC